MNQTIKQIEERTFGDDEFIVHYSKHNYELKGHLRAGDAKQHFKRMREAFK